MFLHYMDDTQKRAFFDLGNQMIRADHVVAPAEICYRDLLIQEAGIGDVPVTVIDNIERHLDMFTDRQSCSALVVELLVLAIVDGNFHPDEDHFAQTVITYFGFTQDDQNHLNRLAEQIAASITGFWDLVQTPSS